MTTTLRTTVIDHKLRIEKSIINFLQMINTKKNEISYWEIGYNEKKRRVEGPH